MHRIHLSRLVAGVGLILCFAFCGVASAPFFAVFPQETAVADPATTADDAPAAVREDELDVLLARIAFYPDELFAVVTSASLYPVQIIEAARYREQLTKDAESPRTDVVG